MNIKKIIMNIKKIIWRYFINGYLVGMIVLNIVSREEMSMVQMLKLSFVTGLLFWPIAELVKKEIIGMKEDWKNADIVGKIMFIIALILFIWKSYIKISRL